MWKRRNSTNARTRLRLRANTIFTIFRFVTKNTRTLLGSVVSNVFLAYSFGFWFSFWFSFHATDAVQSEQQVERLRSSARSAAAVGAGPGGAAPVRRTRSAAGRVFPAASAADVTAGAGKTRRDRQEDRWRRPPSSTRQREFAQQQRQRVQQRPAAGTRNRLLGRRKQQVKKKNHFRLVIFSANAVISTPSALREKQPPGYPRETQCSSSDTVFRENLHSFFSLFLFNLFLLYLMHSIVLRL